jgi:carboxyl-terminal processing protease
MSTRTIAIIFWTCALLLAVKLGMPVFQIETKTSQKDYWRLISLNEDHFEKIVRANQNQLTPLALLNALAYAGQSRNLILTKGIWKMLPRKASNERELLKSVIAENPNYQQWLTIDFLDRWSELKKRTPQEELSYTTASAINGLWSIQFDPHTKIVPTDFIQDSFSQTGSRRSGLGVILGKKQKDFYVKRVLPQSQAEAAGILRGDKLISLDRINVRTLEEAELNRILDQSGKRFFRNTGSQHSLKFERDGQVHSLTIATELKPRAYTRYQTLGVIKRVFYIELFRFAEGVCENMSREIRRINFDAMTGIILDLRDNSGGEIKEAQCVLELFLGEKNFFSLKFRDNSQQIVKGQAPQLTQLPLVVLQNSQSGSSSEIVSGVLQELGRAIVVGERSFGKGSFQTLGEWKLWPKVTLVETQGLYLFPSGSSPQSIGVYPNIFVEDASTFS